MLRSILTETCSSRELILAHCLLMCEIDLGEIDLACIVKAVKFEELSDKLCANHTRCSLHDLFGVRILPVEARLALLNLLLIVNDLEHA